MRIIDITHPPQSLWIGREGENTFRPVSFECANWFSAYPNATIAAYYQPYGSTDPYPLVLVADGTKRIWHPLLNELVKGDGELQIVLMQGETVGTSAIIPTKVDRSLISNADHPESETPAWPVKVVQDVTEQADRAEEAADSIGGAIDEAVAEAVPTAVADYIEEHPIEVTETDPTVPAWAKQPTKPTYTAAEVGALPDSTVIPDISGKVDKVEGKGLSTNDFTSADKAKLDGIESGAQKNTVTSVNGMTGDVVVETSGGGAVDSVNGKTGAVVLNASDVGALPSTTTIPNKTSDLTNDSGFVTAQQAAASAPVQSVNGQTGAVVLGAADVHALPDSTVIPPTVTEQTVAGWGFTKNTGTYSKPESGIPASDLASGVQTSLGKADTALQSHQSLAAYRTATAQDTIDAGKLGTTGNAYRSASIPMGHLDATSTATVMTATVDGITELRDGVCMWLRNGVITSASGFTLNVNNLGAKPCYSSLAAASRSTTIFNVNYTMLLIYNSTRVDGGCWDIVYGVDTNTTYTPPKLGFGYGTCTTAAATAAKTASISSYALTAGGIVSIKFDNDVPANATLNITSKGAKAIYHRGAAITAGVIKAGDTATFIYSTYYHLIAIDRKYLTLDDLPIYDGGVS